MRIRLIFLGLFLVTLSLPAAAQTALPHPDHVVIVIEENKNFTDVIGSANAPYLNSLAAAGALLTNYYGLHHPSQPNYIELFSGNAQGVCNDTCPAALINAPNLAAALLAAQKGFAGYAENLPKDLSACRQGDYARKHCPWVSFAGLPPSASRDFSTFPNSPDGFAGLPSVSFVIPNLIHDMHSTNMSVANPIPAEVRDGDAWLSKNLDAYVKWAATHNSLLVITWDEDASIYRYPQDCAQGINTKPPANHIPTIVVGEPVRSGARSSAVYDHYSLLRTIEDFCGLAPIGRSAGAQPITGIWK